MSKGSQFAATNEEFIIFLVVVSDNAFHVAFHFVSRVACKNIPSVMLYSNIPQNLMVIHAEALCSKLYNIL